MEGIDSQIEKRLISPPKQFQKMAKYHKKKLELL